MALSDTMPAPVLAPIGQAARQKKPHCLKLFAALQTIKMTLHLYGLRWLDAQPDPATIRRLMQDAEKVIDEWIESRL